MAEKPTVEQLAKFRAYTRNSLILGVVLLVGGIVFGLLFFLRVQVIMGQTGGVELVFASTETIPTEIGLAIFVVTLLAAIWELVAYGLASVKLAQVRAFWGDIGAASERATKTITNTEYATYYNLRQTRGVYGVHFLLLSLLIVTFFHPYTVAWIVSSLLGLVAISFFLNIAFLSRLLGSRVHVVVPSESDDDAEIASIVRERKDMDSEPLSDVAARLGIALPDDKDGS